MSHSTAIELGPPLTPGELCTVNEGSGLVVFAHADGGAQSTRRSADLALRLQAQGLNTLVFDLLTVSESQRADKLDDVPLLAQRLLQAIDAVPPAQRALPLGLFGSDTGTAAALVVAAQRPQTVRAVVSRGGRPDLAAHVLGDVRAPTLLLVGAGDAGVLELNRQAYARLRCTKRIDIVPRATHLFLEAGTFDVVARHAAVWFREHLGVPDA